MKAKQDVKAQPPSEAANPIDYSAPVSFKRVKVVHIWSSKQRKYKNFQKDAAFHFLKKYSSNKSFLVMRYSDSSYVVYDVTKKTPGQLLDLMEFFSIYASVIGVGKVKFQEDGAQFQVQKKFNVSLNSVFKSKEATVKVVKADGGVLTDKQATDYLRKGSISFSVSQKFEAVYTESGALAADIHSNFTFTEIRDTDDSSGQAYPFCIRLNNASAVDGEGVVDLSARFTISVREHAQAS